MGHRPPQVQKPQGAPLGWYRDHQHDPPPEPEWVRKLDLPVLRPWLGGYLHPGWQDGFEWMRRNRPPLRGGFWLLTSLVAVILALLGYISTGQLLAFVSATAIINSVLYEFQKTFETDWETMEIER